MTGSDLSIHYGFCSESSETEQVGNFTKPTELTLTGAGSFTTIEIRDSEGNTVTFPNCDCERLYAEYKNSPLMQSSILANLIEQDHCVLQGMTTTGEGLGSETEFMRGLNTMIDGFALIFTATAGSAVLLPIIAENLSVNVTKEVLKTQVVNKSKDFAMGFALDGFIQMLIIKLSDNENASLDYYQMTASGIENTFNSAYLSVVVSCGFDAMFENGQLKTWDVIQEWDETGWDCALGALSALAGEGGSRLVGAGAGALMRSIKNNPQKFVNLLKSLGLNDESVDRLVKKFGGGEGWFGNLPVGLKNDIESTVALRDIFENSDNEARGALVDSWKRIDDHLGEVGELVRKNPDALKQVDDAIKEGLDATDAIEDAAQTLGKTKPTWDEIKALFKRGNDFNRKANDSEWYDFHEIHLQNGKRLDSYDPIAGEIVSRKATDFDNIQPSTFENYLKEIDNKYSPGTVIRSNKYPELDGQTLQGSKILEIPASNQTSSRLGEFTELAEQYNVTLRFRSE